MVMAPRPMRETTRAPRCAFFMSDSWFQDYAVGIAELYGLQETPVRGGGEVAAGRCTGSPPLVGAVTGPPAYCCWGVAEARFRVTAQLASRRSASSAADPAGA